MGQKIFIVHARRWGSAETHSYIVGVFDSEADALRTAEAEEERRGGKYECEVLAFTIGERPQDEEATMMMPREVIKPLPKVNTLRARGKPCRALSAEH